MRSFIANDDIARAILGKLKTEAFCSIIRCDIDSTKYDSLLPHLMSGKLEA